MTITIDQFMRALSGQESGGSSTAQNGRTGAYGTYQIMPENWPTWSREAGIAGAAQTPENQEKVARFKIQQYYDKFHDWGDVAAAWYSGSPTTAYTQEQLNRKQGAGNEPSIAEYVNSVLTRAGDSSGAVNGRAPLADGTSTSSGNSGNASGSDTAAGIFAQLQGALAQEPKADDPRYNEVGADGSTAYNAQAYARDHTAWSQTVAALDNLYKNYTAAADRKDQGAANRIAQQNADTTASHYAASDQNAADVLAQKTADDAITQFYRGQGESRNRADLVFKGQQELSKYGVPLAGAQDFSYQQLMGAGAGGAYAKLFGVSPDATAYHVLGTQYIDPAGQMAANDNLLGVTGAPPQGANLIGGYSPSVAPAAPSLSGAIAGMPGLPAGGQAQGGLNGVRNGISGVIAGAGNLLGGAGPSDADIPTHQYGEQPPANTAAEQARAAYRRMMGVA